MTTHNDLHAALVDPGRSPRIRMDAVESYVALRREVDAESPQVQLGEGEVLFGSGASRTEIGALLRHARIFEVDGSELQHLVDDLVEYVESLPTANLGALLRAAATNVPRMPFEAVWVGVKNPHVTHGSFWGVRESEVRVCAVGWLITATETYYFALDEQDRLGVTPSRFVGGETVFDPRLGDPTTAMWASLTVPRVLMRMVADCAHAVRETGYPSGLRSRLADGWKEREAPQFQIPKKYRRIQVAGSLRFVSAARKAIVSCGPAWSVVHRVDVRGHWWIRCRRGPGTIPGDLRQALDERYVWEDDTTSPAVTGDDELTGLLSARGIFRRRPGEWMAVLKRWVSEYQRGPEDGQYVPAVWRVSPPQTRSI